MFHVSHSALERGRHHLIFLHSTVEREACSKGLEMIGEVGYNISFKVFVNVQVTQVCNRVCWTNRTIMSESGEFNFPQRNTDYMTFFVRQIQALGVQLC